MNDPSAYLYEKNAVFWTDKTGSPVNYNEIMENLRTKYGVSDSLPGQRVIQATLLFIFTLVLAVITSLLILTIVVDFLDGTMTVYKFVITLLVALPTLGGTYVCASTTFGLIAHRQWAVEKDWSNLLSKGILLEGKVTDTDYIGGRERRVTYEFFDMDGKRRRGRYFLPPRMVSIGSKVAVWYVDRKLHTLL